MSGGMLGGDIPEVLAEMGIVVAVDPAMPEGVVELRYRTGENNGGIAGVMILPGTPAEQRERDIALQDRAIARVRAGRTVAWSNEAQESLDRMNSTGKDDRP